MVGAKGFEPSTSWSRTKDNQSHKRFSWRRLRDQDHCFPSFTCTLSCTHGSEGRQMDGREDAKFFVVNVAPIAHLESASAF